MGTIPVPRSSAEVVRALPVRIDTPLLFPTPSGRRHSWVTHLRAAGIDPADLAAAAGHTVETATARYTHALGRSDDRIR